MSAARLVATIAAWCALVILLPYAALKAGELSNEVHECRRERVQRDAERARQRAIIDCRLAGGTWNEGTVNGRPATWCSGGGR